MIIPTHPQVNDFFKQLTLTKISDEQVQACESEVYTLVYDCGFMLADFDWFDYGRDVQGRHLGKELLENFSRYSEQELQDLIGQLDYDDIFKIITAAVRGDRFCGGYWAQFVGVGALRILLADLAKRVGNPIVITQFKGEITYKLELEESERRLAERRQRQQQNNIDSDFF